jgi:8-oxo-dGTP pyrophosphatase MutT (NUDIX family)
LVNRKARLLVLNYPFVLAFKKRGQDRYSLIGGNIEKKERPTASMIREAKEEASIKIGAKDITWCGLLTEVKQGILHERNYFVLLEKDHDFFLNEPEKFEALEWIDFFDNQTKFKKLDRKMIKKQFTSMEL